MALIFQRAVVIGTGLIGGSVALAAREAGIVGTLVGVARTERTRRHALETGVVDEATPEPRAAAAAADLVYIAAPLGSTKGILQAIAPVLGPDCLVTDAGSAKAGVVRDAGASLPHPGMFVGGHPMAGAETAGVQHARVDLFRGRAYFLTPTEHTSDDALDRTKALVAALGANLLIASPAEHDDIVASISHLPHVAAVALMHLVARREAPGDIRLAAAGGGFRDMTRIAASPAAMWREILAANRDQALRWLEAYTGELEQVADMLRRQDWDALEDLLAAAGRARQRSTHQPRRRAGDNTFRGVNGT
ncbi:MAG: prephenate dehydrogenase/arogenate dehydrogenase family protein [Armatimonadota bacterium]|jgi:prephenate dehydrogenase